jgi:hypothetical protein
MNAFTHGIMLANGGLAVNDCSFLGQLFLPFLSFPFTFLIDLFSMCFFPLYAFLSHSFHYALELLIALLFLAAHSCPIAFHFSLFSPCCIFIIFIELHFSKHDGIFYAFGVSWFIFFFCLIIYFFIMVIFLESQ